MEQLQCFACLNVFLSCNDGKKNINPTVDECKASDQQEALFLLRRFLGIPEEIYRKLQDFGNPLSWLHYCNTCRVLVGKAKDIVDEIEALKIKFNDLQTEFKNTIFLSADSQLRENAQSEAKNQIRTYICEVHHLSSTELKLMNSDDEPMNDDASYTSLTEDVDEEVSSTIMEAEGQTEDRGESQLLNFDLTDKFLCGVCNKEFATDLDQKNHLCDSAKLKVFLESLVVNSRKYSCHVCKTSFKLAAHLEKHIESHTNPVQAANSKFVCKICNKPFERVRDLERHLRTHEKQPVVRDCSFCGKTFKTSKDLKEHIRTHTGEKPYECEICGNRFRRSSHLKKHISTHRNHLTK